MAAAQSGARLRSLTAKARRGTRVDDLRGAIIERHLHVAEHGDDACVHLRVEAARLALAFTGLCRAAFGLPGRKATVEDEHVLGAEHAERPPHARRGKCARAVEAVIDDDGIAIADAERADCLRKL